MRLTRRATWAAVVVVAALAGWMLPARTAGTAPVASSLDVIISELMYHPPGGDAENEFIELTNRGTQPVDLSNWRIDDGVRCVFPRGTILPAGERLVIAAKPAAIESFHGITGVLGPYEGRLDNGGERLELRDAAGGLVCEVQYDDEAPWPAGGDGDGRSIELIDLARNHNVGRFWAPSTKIMGTPGAANGNGAPPPVNVLINEFLANSEGESDFIELYNASETAIDINGFFLTDNPGKPTKAKIKPSWSAGGTIIPAKGYWVSRQSDWGFGLSSEGEQIYLIAADGKTWIDGRDFGLQPVTGVPEARYPDGGSDWVRPPAGTPGAANIAPRVNRSVFINEIMYHPADDDGSNAGSEYVELHNAGAQTADVSGWKLAGGINYTFPPGTTIPAGGFLVAAADPARVQMTYNITGVNGPWKGKLSNFSDAIELKDRLGNRVDFIEYREAGLWPKAADGDGPSLELISTTPGYDHQLPGLWKASLASGTPGRANSRLSTDVPPPSIDRVSHSPLVPTSKQAVTVSALIGPGQCSPTLYYKRDGSESFIRVDMHDSQAAGGHAPSGGGIWHGNLPAQPDGTIVQFYIEVRAASDTPVRFPPGAPSKTCLYVVQDDEPVSNLNIFRFILTDESWNALLAAPEDDALRDCTFIYADKVWYNCGVRFRGGYRKGPKYSYKVHLPPGQRFRGADQFNLNYEKADRTLLKNKIVNHLLESMGLPAAQTEFVHTRWRNDNAGVHLYAEAQDKQFLERHFPGDSGGNLYKAVVGGTTVLRGENVAWGGARQWYEKQTNKRSADWSDLDALYAATRVDVPDSLYEAGIRAQIDVTNWARSFAAWAVTCHIDSPWHVNNQNHRLYRRGSDNRFVHLLYDFDDIYWPTMWNNTGLYASVFPDVNRFLKWPAFQREYLHGVWRAVNATDGVFREARIRPEVAYYHGLIYDDALADPFIKSDTENRRADFLNARTQWDEWLTTRNKLLRRLLPEAALAVTSPAAPYTTASPKVTLEGTAPIGAARLEVFGSEDGIEWQSATNWRKSIVFTARNNPVLVRTLDDAGNELQRITIDFTYTYGESRPAGQMG